VEYICHIMPNDSFHVCQLIDCLRNLTLSTASPQCLEAVALTPNHLLLFTASNLGPCAVFTLSRDANDTTSWSGPSVSGQLALLMATPAKVVGASMNNNGTLGLISLCSSQPYHRRLCKMSMTNYSRNEERNIPPKHSRVQST